MRRRAALGLAGLVLATALFLLLGFRRPVAVDAGLGATYYAWVRDEDLAARWVATLTTG